MSAEDEFEDDEPELDAPDVVVEAPEAAAVEVEDDLVVPPPVRSLTVTARSFPPCSPF